MMHWSAGLNCICPATGSNANAFPELCAITAAQFSSNSALCIIAHWSKQSFFAMYWDVVEVRPEPEYCLFSALEMD